MVVSFFSLFEGGSDAVDACVAVQEKRTGVFGDRVPVRAYQGHTKTGGCATFARSCRTMASVAGVKTDFTPCFKRKVMGRIRLIMSARNFLRTDHPKRERNSLRSSGIDIFTEVATLLAFGRRLRATPARRSRRRHKHMGGCRGRAIRAAPIPAGFLKC